MLAGQAWVPEVAAPPPFIEMNGHTRGHPNVGRLYILVQEGVEYRKQQRCRMNRQVGFAKPSHLSENRRRLVMYATVFNSEVKKWLR